MKHAFLVIVFVLLTHRCIAVTFPVSGGESEDRRIVVSYDVTRKHFGPGEGPTLLLVDSNGQTIATFPDLEADWSWSGEHPELAIHKAAWNDTGDLVYVIFQAGRLYSGFDVYRLADNKLIRVDVHSVISALHEKHLVGPPPLSPNVALSRVISWLNASTLLCAMEREDITYFVAVELSKQSAPKLVHIFTLSEEIDRHR